MEGIPGMYSFARRVVFPLVRLGYDLDVSGRENVPDSPVIVASNHSHIFDAAAICESLDNSRPIYFVARNKNDLLYTLKRKAMENFGCVMVNQERTLGSQNLLTNGAKTLEEGNHLAIFPEGRYVMEKSLGKFYDGAARLSINTQVPIVPVYLGFKETKFFGKVPVRFGKIIIPPTKEGNGTNKKSSDLTAILRESIEELSRS